VDIKIKNFVGNILQSKIYACYYISLSGTRPKHECTQTYLWRCCATSCATGSKTKLFLTA